MSESVKLYNPSGREVKVAADKVQEHLVRGFTYAPTAPKKVVEKIIANAKANKASVASVLSVLITLTALKCEAHKSAFFHSLGQGLKCHSKSQSLE